MSTVRVTKKVREDYERLLKNQGEDKLYRIVLGRGFNDKTQFDYPELVLLDRADAFFSLYRSTGNEDYFTIGKILRRAAHKLYRELHRINKNHPINARFLNMLKPKCQ